MPISGLRAWLGTSMPSSRGRCRASLWTACSSSRMLPTSPSTPGFGQTPPHTSGKSGQWWPVSGASPWIWSYRRRLTMPAVSTICRDQRHLILVPVPTGTVIGQASGHQAAHSGVSCIASGICSTYTPHDQTRYHCCPGPPGKTMIPAEHNGKTEGQFFFLRAHNQISRKGGRETMSTKNKNIFWGILAKCKFSNIVLILASRDMVEPNFIMPENDIPVILGTIAISLTNPRV